MFNKYVPLSFLVLFGSSLQAQATFGPNFLMECNSSRSVDAGYLSKIERDPSTKKFFLGLSQIAGIGGMHEDLGREEVSVEGQKLDENKCRITVKQVSDLQANRLELVVNFDRAKKDQEGMLSVFIDGRPISDLLKGQSCKVKVELVREKCGLYSGASTGPGGRGGRARPGRTVTQEPPHTTTPAAAPQSRSRPRAGSQP